MGCMYCRGHAGQRCSHPDCRVETVEATSTGARTAVVRFDASVVEVIQQLRERYPTHVEVSQVLEDALGLLKWAAEEMRTGNKVGSITPNGVGRELVLPFKGSK